MGPKGEKGVTGTVGLQGPNVSFTISALHVQHSTCIYICIFCRDREETRVSRVSLVTQEQGDKRHMSIIIVQIVITVSSFPPLLPSSLLPLPILSLPLLSTASILPLPLHLSLITGYDG